MRVSVVVFEINEIAGMRATMPQILPEWYDELIVVDGGSTDGTLEYVQELGHTIFVQKEKGVGAALKEAMERVTGDVIVLYAPDGSFLTDRIPLMLEKIRQGADFVNISRYLPGAHSEDDNFFTGMGNRVFSLLARVVFGWTLTDWLYTYLAFKRDSFLHLDMAQVATRDWGQILLARAYARGFQIVELPGDEPLRIGGSVKVPKMRAAWALLKTLYRERATRRLHRQAQSAP